MSKYQIYLIRHGKTWFNRYQKIQGWSDTPLTQDGVEVAHSAAESLKNVDFAAAFSSDTRRAMDTAEIIAKANKNKPLPQKMTEFREQFYGSFEGDNIDEAWNKISNSHNAKNYQEIVYKYGFDATMDFVKEADPFHDAESAEEYWDRLDRGFEKIDQIAHDGDKILLVTHSTTILSLAFKYQDGDYELNQLPGNSSLTMLERIDGTNHVTSYNQKLH